MNSYPFHINLYDLAFLGAIFTGLTFALLLWFIKSANRSANRFLALALAAMILWMVRVLAIDIRLEIYLPGWDWLPMQFLLALGPLLYFYVLKITCPQYKFKWNDLLHFSPLLLELAALALETRESARTGAVTYATHTFQLLNPVLQLLIFISILTYLHLCNKLIQNFYRRLQPVLMDRPLLEFRWLRRLLAATALLWCLWIACAAIFYFGYPNQSGAHVYYPFYIFFVVMIIWTAAAAFLKPQAAVMAQTTAPPKPTVPAELREKGILLKRVMEANLYYQDPETSLSSLAEKLGLHPHELSRVINTGLKKSFNDFINEYRVKDVVSKMKDPAYDNITLLGIAFEAGFNSKATFNRVFKQMTGKSPAEFKNNLEKEDLSYHLRPYSHSSAVISNHQATPKWADMKLNRKFMFRSYLKISWRYLLRNKGFSAINIAGLAIGMASAMLILLWVQNELGFDRFHEKTSRIYAMYNRNKINGEVRAVSQTPEIMAGALKQRFPEVEDAVRFNGVTFLMSVGDKHLNVQGAFVDTGFLSMFSFPLALGDVKKSLHESYNIVLTQGLAKRLFGNENAIGKTVRIDSTDNFTVSAVLKELPGNTTFNFEYLLPYAYNVKLGWTDSNWTNNFTYTYVLLKPGTTEQSFDAKVKNLIINNTRSGNQQSTAEVFTQPLSRLYLYSRSENGNLVGGRIEVVNLFIWIAVFILLIACINFMNLSTARSEKRAKEVGIRKVAGAHKSALIIQFICESIILAFIAFIIAVFLVKVSLPAFNTLTGRQLILSVGNPLYWLGGVVFTGFIAGSYPAFYLSSFVPVKVLKGSFKKVNALVTPRKVLVVLQFTFAIILIISTLIVQHQIQYAQGRDAGYNRSNLVFTFNQGDVDKNYDIIKHDLLSSGAVVSVTKSANPITRRWSSGSGYIWQGSSAGEKKTDFVRLGSDADFVKTMGVTLAAGRDIDINKYPADSTAMLLNETAVRMMHLKNPVGQIIRRENYPNQWHVVGVIKDFILESPYENVNPTMVLGPLYFFQVIHFKLNAANSVTVNMDKVEAIFKKYNPQYPFEYVFADDAYAQKFTTEKQTGQLAALFAGLTIFISCLGLLGLAAYMAEQRTKEIGIRKVLGASVQSVVALISADFVKLIVVALLIASPVAWLLMDKWLENYGYRIQISIWIFAIAGLLAIGLALLTISFQAIKAALANPVKSLRSE